jgi:hypothetical protein
VRKLIVPVVGTLAMIMGAAGGCGGAGLSGNEGLATPVAAVAAADPALTVTNVVDGDTVDLSDQRRVRLLGVDTPEWGACGFDEASKFARDTLLNKPVEVAPDPTQDDIDAYGRSHCRGVPASPADHRRRRCGARSETRRAPCGCREPSHRRRPDGRSLECQTS